MSASNGWHATGFVCSEPEIKRLDSGTSVVGFRFRTTRLSKKSGEWEKKAVFCSVQMWGRQAERFHEKIMKGDPVSLQGELDFDEWKDAEGNKRSRNFLTATGWEYLPRKKEESDKQPF